MGNKLPGETCMINVECKSLNCASGHCGTLPPYTDCTNNVHCQSGACANNRCTPNPVGYVCRGDYDCWTNSCNQHTCEALPPFSTCGHDWQCQSNECHHGLCTKNPIGTTCSNYNDCWTNHCHAHGICYHCTEDQDCIYDYHMEPNPNKPGQFLLHRTRHHSLREWKCYTETGVCGPRKQEGDECEKEKECAGDLWCGKITFGKVFNTVDDPVSRWAIESGIPYEVIANVGKYCHKPLPEGEDCTSDNQCIYPLYCGTTGETAPRYAYGLSGDGGMEPVQVMRLRKCRA